MNYETQYYKGIPLNLVKRKYGNRNAKRFVINHSIMCDYWFNRLFTRWMCEKT